MDPDAACEAHRRATSQLQAAVRALESIGRVLERGTADSRKLATIRRLVDAALPSNPGGR